MSRGSSLLRPARISESRSRIGMSAMVRSPREGEELEERRGEVGRVGSPWRRPRTSPGRCPRRWQACSGRFDLGPEEPEPLGPDREGGLLDGHLRPGRGRTIPPGSSRGRPPTPRPTGGSRRARRGRPCPAGRPPSRRAPRPRGGCRSRRRPRGSPTRSGRARPRVLREQRGLRRRGFQIPVAAIGEIEDAVVVADPDHGQVAAAQPQGDVDRHPGGARGEMEGAARQLHPGAGDDRVVGVAGEEGEDVREPPGGFLAILARHGAGHVVGHAAGAALRGAVGARRRGDDDLAEELRVAPGVVGLLRSS